jgi:hypothetical protein
LTTGYDRAFGIGAAVLAAGALVALLVPAKLGIAPASITAKEPAQPALVAADV